MKKTNHRDSIQLSCTRCIERMLLRKVMNNAILWYPRLARKKFVSKYLLVVSVSFFFIFFSYPHKRNIRMTKCDCNKRNFGRDLCCCCCCWTFSYSLNFMICILVFSLLYFIINFDFTFFPIFFFFFFFMFFNLEDSSHRYHEKDGRFFPFSYSITLHLWCPNSIFYFCCPDFFLYQIENLEQLHDVSQLLLVGVRIQ